MRSLFLVRGLALLPLVACSKPAEKPATAAPKPFLTVIDNQRAGSRRSWGT